MLIGNVKSLTISGDIILIIGDIVIDCNMQYPCRELEINYLPLGEPEQMINVLRVPREKNIYFGAANVCRLDNTLSVFEMNG